MNNKIKSKAMTLLPYWSVIILVELMQYIAFIGPRPSYRLIFLVCPIPLLGLFLLDFIPAIHRLLEGILQYIKMLLKSIPNHRWKRFIIMLLADSALGLITERILDIHLAFNWRLWLWASVCYFVPSLLIVFRDLLTSKIETIVFLISLSIGTVFATTLPTSTGIAWDDETHFRSVLQLSHILDARMTGGDFEEISDFEATALEHDRYTLESHAKWVAYLDAADRDNDWMGVGRLLPTPQNLCYFPSAAANFVGRVLHLPYHIIYILGRWANLFAYSLLLFFSIRKIKTGKMIVATVGLIPPILFMAGAYARDPWMIGWIMLAFCYMIGEIQTPEKKLTLFDVIFMLFAFGLGIAPKAIYFPLMLICLFMPAEKFSEKKWHRAYLSIFAIGALLAVASFAIPFILSGGGGQGDIRGGSNVAASSQSAFILNNPTDYAKILFSFLGEYISWDAALKYLNYMHYFGTADFSLLTAIMLLVVALTDRGETDNLIKWNVKLSTLFAGFLCIVLAATAMYISFTPYKHDTILGCQYRYMFQIFFPTLFVLGSFRFENKLFKSYSYEKIIPQNWYRGIILSIMSFILLNGLWDLCIKGFM